MKKKLLILACAYPTAGHLMTLISVSMWLTKKKINIRSKNKIELQLLPNPKKGSCLLNYDTLNIYQLLLKDH